MEGDGYWKAVATYWSKYEIMKTIGNFNSIRLQMTSLLPRMSIFVLKATKQLRPAS